MGHYCSARSENGFLLNKPRTVQVDHVDVVGSSKYAAACLRNKGTVTGHDGAVGSLQTRSKPSHVFLSPSGDGFDGGANWGAVLWRDDPV